MSHTSDKVESIEDEQEKEQIKRQGRRVHMKAIATAVIITLATLLLPV